jgi:hypothetical protein
MFKTSSFSDSDLLVGPDVAWQIVVTLSFPIFLRMVERSINEQQSLSDLTSQRLDNTC